MARLQIKTRRHPVKGRRRVADYYSKRIFFSSGMQPCAEGNAGPLNSPSIIRKNRSDPAIQFNDPASFLKVCSNIGLLQ